MRYSDILNQKELKITRDKLRRYRQYGLIRTELKSKGRGSGVRAEVSEQSFEALKEIENLISNPFIKNIPETIFILFMKGYPVDIEILKKKLNVFYQEKIKNLETINMRFLVDKLNFHEDLRSNLKLISGRKKVGRPTKESEEALEKGIVFIMETLKRFQPLIALFLGEETDQFIEKPINNIDLNIKEVPFWLDNQYWIDLIENSQEYDFDQILKLRNSIRYYEDALRTSFSLNVIINKVDEFLDLNNWDERPNSIKLLILVLLQPDIRDFLIEFLENDATKKAWKNLLKGGAPDE